MWDRIRATDAWFQQKCAKKLRAIVKSCSRPPTIFAYSYGAKAVFEAARQLGCRTVLGQIDPGPVEMRLVQQLEQEHGFTDLEWPDTNYWDDWKDECRLADLVVVNSEWSRQALMKEGAEDSKIRVIPLAYEKAVAEYASDSQLPDRFTSARPLRVLFLGQVNLRKGVKELISAIKLLNGSPVEWTIVGGGDVRLRRELDNLPRTNVTGPVSRQDVHRYYQAADVFILPTHSDGFALTQLEAAAYGLPIVASEFCGEVVTDGVNGIRLPQVSGNAIAEAVRNLAGDSDRVEQMSHAQRQATRLSQQELGKLFLSILQPDHQSAA